MADEIIQGDWDDVVTRQDLRGRKVRVIVLDEEEPSNPWITSLLAWANSHTPLGYVADDSRESIYSGTVDDPR